MKCGITSPYIEELKPGERFVFGSNTEGRHGAGAARMARLKFGAVYGEGYGLQGNSYALPTLDGALKKLPLSKIKDQVETLRITTICRPELHFLITPVGTGLAGFTVEEIAPMFKGFEEYENVSLPMEFLECLKVK